MSRELHKVVDILFAPYNYLIDPGNRKSLTIEWSNSILIFDEAHNLVSIVISYLRYICTCLCNACDKKAYHIFFENIGEHMCRCCLF